ncbi:NAD binding domain of 6-phosphogluconate dehydrogenase [Actinoalloteichus hoggarensis]|uniref:NAD binding domain of 6-phosphogluconate dehydrogenase n=2 Tax=Actinoalloteichus hoggarensis TaxID=1470176 RepID=A0A221W4F2_9PSEU|nr:NAD binding domain of 6-phosphogluconate dehydrogenase [Actinoalloteichus hoggarensis]
MGRALATALTTAGHDTTVWNRTPGKATGLAVTVADTAAEASAASPLVLVCVRDQSAAEAILDADALRGRTLVNFTGNSPRQARALASWARDHDVTCLDGVIIATPDIIGTPAATLYYSGPHHAYQAHRPVLAALGENADHVGTDPGRAAALDTSLQDLLWTALSGVVHAFTLAAAEDIAPDEFAARAKNLIGILPDMIDQIAEQLDTGHFPGDDTTMDSVGAVMDHILDTVRFHDLDNGVLSAARADVRRAVDAGHGTAGYARLAAR